MNKYINTALNFTGSKYNLLEQILPEFDYSKEIFADLFCGSLVVSSNVADKFKNILANDIIKDLVNIHNNIFFNFDDFIKSVKNLSVSKDDKEGFLNLRESYNKNKSADKLYALILTSTNNMMRFNNKFQYNQTFGKRSFNDKTEEKLNNYKKFIEPYKNKFNFSATHFADIKITKPCMIYLDPPYGYIMNDNGSMGNTQISEAGYNAFYKKEDDIILYNYFKTAKKYNNHSVMLSGLLEHNNKKSWVLNKLINDGYRYKILEKDYNKVSRKNIDKNSKEIIIMNY